MQSNRQFYRRDLSDDECTGVNLKACGGDVVAQPVDIILQKGVQRNSKLWVVYFLLREMNLNASCRVLHSSASSVNPLMDTNRAGDLELIELAAAINCYDLSLKRSYLMGLKGN